MSPEMLEKIIKEENLDITLPKGIYAMSEEKHSVQEREKVQT